MDNYLEFDSNKKTLKSINLDDFSVEDLKEYIAVLMLEVKRAKEEEEKKIKIKTEALKFFK